jgi:hypothetical protein
MAELILKEGLPENFLSNLNYVVGIDVWGYSSSTPIATVGAAPCLNVVVHNRGTNEGCLAHVGHTSLNQTELFMKALRAIEIMAWEAIVGANTFDIWFGAGYAFVENSIYAPEERYNIDFVTFIKQQLALKGYPPVKILDNRIRGRSHDDPNPDPGNVVYWPALHTVYIIKRGIDEQIGNTDDRDLHGVQRDPHTGQDKGPPPRWEEIR